MELRLIDLVKIYSQPMLVGSFPVKPPLTPEQKAEKAAKKAAKKAYQNASYQEQQKLYKEKLDKAKEEHPGWFEWELPKGYPSNGCFGYIAGHLLVGSRHHQAIMSQLLDNGWTWTDLMTAEQVWGWYDVVGPGVNYGYEAHPARVSLNFVSDAATMNEEAVEGCKQAFMELYGVEQVTGDWYDNRDVERHGLEYGGDFDRHYIVDGKLKPNNVIKTDLTPVPPPPSLKEELVPA